MNIGLLGGTFDPIHEEHVKLASEFARRLSLDRVIIMPVKIPPHKLKDSIAPENDRLEMCRLAVGDDPLFEVSDYEITRGGASYTVNTLEWLAETRPGCKIFLLTGADMFLTLGTWYRFGDIAGMAVLCAAPRGGVTKEQLEKYASTLSERGARCVVEDIELARVSSTELRKRLAAGEDTCGMIADDVAKYIARRGLYKTLTCFGKEEQYIELLKGRLSSKRFRHSLAVAEQAVHLAGIYGADPDKARVAGLLHDIMKETSREEQLQILGDFGIILDKVVMAAPKCWHGVTGSVFLRGVLMIEDEDILNAVRYHTTARAGMSPLEITLFLADFTSADRDYEDVDVLRQLAEAGYHEAMVYALSFTIRDLMEKRRMVHPDTLDAYNSVISQGFVH